jgi:alkylated DNA repair dioxygenase AlkB
LLVVLGLFSFDATTFPINPILPKDGELIYSQSLLDDETAIRYFNRLMETIDWQQDELVIYGKQIQTKRKVAWYGDVPFSYTYSHKEKKALYWTKELLELKEVIEQKTGVSYNSCLLNLYHSGAEGMGWHSDNEPELQINGSIASLSLGAARVFDFKHKTTKEKVRILLENGSLLEMKGTTQSNWLHQLPKTLRVKDPRINLTFRTIVRQD